MILIIIHNFFYCSNIEHLTKKKSFCKGFFKVYFFDFFKLFAFSFNFSWKPKLFLAKNKWVKKFWAKDNKKHKKIIMQKKVSPLFGKKNNSNIENEKTSL